MCVTQGNRIFDYILRNLFVPSRIQQQHVVYSTLSRRWGLFVIFSHSERVYRCCLNGGFAWELKILSPPPPQHLDPFLERTTSRTGSVAPAATGRKTEREAEGGKGGVTEWEGKKQSNRREDGERDPDPWPCEGPTYLEYLTTLLASFGFSLLSSEHAFIARFTSSGVPWQQVPDHELRREQSFFLSLHPRVLNRNPAAISRGRRKEVGTFLFWRRSPGEGGGHGPEVTRTSSGWSEPSGGCESRSRASSRILRSGEARVRAVSKRARGVEDESLRASSELGFFRSSPA